MIRGGGRKGTRFEDFGSKIQTLPITALCIAFSCLSIPPIEANSLINVSLNADISDFGTETYSFVHRILNKRLVPGITRGSLPLTRGEVVSLLSALSQKHIDGEIELSYVDKQHLRALMQLYTDELPLTHVGSRRWLHVMHSKDDDYHLVFDLAASQRAISRSSAAFPMRGITHITSLIPHVHGQIRDDFAFSTNPGYNFLYGEIFADILPDETWYPHGIEGNLENRVPIDAYLKFKLPWFELQIGQDKLRWGVGYHGTLLVSENPTAIDMIRLKASFKHLTFCAFTAILEDENSEVNEKFLSGHRIEGYFWDRLGVGLSEVIVYGDRFELSYVNPVNVYLVDMVTTERGDSRAVRAAGGIGDNILISGDVRCRLTDDLEVYGELMIDDGNPAKDFHHWDTKFGVLGGVYVTDPFRASDTDLRAEYAFINQYAYTHGNPVNVYKHFSSVIGHQIGADADNLWIELRHRFTDKLGLTVTYDLERHGEGNVNTPHPSDAPADDRWTPLSGITQGQHDFTFGINYAAIGQYSFAADFTQRWVQNLGNQAGVDETGQQIRVKTLYRF